ncbi:MAG: hypothetical protein JJE39_02130 [Vicinamibacteria bacterium]|nr:hypothetical protein [Vicinamibacteria bacterium]
MKPWMKIAIGCLATSIIALFLFVAGLVGLGYWAKGKVEEVAGGGAAVAEARKTANAVPFNRPLGNVIPEARLVRFIEIRASVFSVYEKYRGEIESRMAKVKESKSVDFGDLSTGLTLVGEIQKAEALALARHGMSEREYAFITGEVYKSMFTEAAESRQEVIESAAGAAKTASDAVKGMTRNDPSSLPPEAREAIAQAGADIAASSRDASEQVAEMRIAPENTILFKKYKAELKKYAMPGLKMFFDEDAQAGDNDKAQKQP